MNDDQHLSSRMAGSSYSAPLYDTTALTSALANPYAQHMSPHYYQAYYSILRPRTTAEGYTLSSTYVPITSSRTSKTSWTTSMSSPRDRPAVKPILNHLTYGSWYQPGNCRCTRSGCPFTGSRKSVEIHMMDRHFIFPPGWERKDSWDADPSLRGKPIAIQGTSLVLDTPEAISAWIAERKRRFPTDQRVQDKKRKLEEAAARGQLGPEDIGTGARKKYKQNATFTDRPSKEFRGKGRHGRRGRRPEGITQHEEPRTEIVDHPTSQLIDAKTSTREANTNSAPTADDDEAPEVVSSKAPTTSLYVPEVDAGHIQEAQVANAPSQEHRRKFCQPKNPPRNPFVSRSTLLRNVLATCYSLASTVLTIFIVKLLLPEIRVTVSNLSQSIRFLVENDFLRGVELQPGEAQEQMIEVLGSSETPR